MTWYYSQRKYEREEIARVIHKDGLRVGWELNDSEIGVWKWCRIRPIKKLLGGTVLHEVEFVRDCTPQEAEELWNLMNSAQIVLRYRAVKKGRPWALACID